MRISILSAATAAFIAVTASSVSALPVAKPSQTGAETTAMTEQVRHKRGHYGKRNWRHNNDDRRYEQYRGWNRYSRRPHNHRSRGCVAVGPVWFCK